MNLRARLGALALALATTSCTQADAVKEDASAAIDAACPSAVTTAPHCAKQSWWWNLP